jgi:phytoene dehydrogenase-like protein
MAFPWLVVVALGLVALVNPATAQLAISPSNPVCIVGAGAAGLSAANVLRAASVPLVILEARARAGGRVWSAPILGLGSSGAEPVTIDLGAGWLEGDGPANPMYSLARPWFNETVLSDFESGESYYTTGGEAPDPTEDWEEFLEGPVEDEREEAGTRTSLGTLVRWATEGEPNQERLRRQWQGLLGVTNEYAADLGQMSGMEWDSAGDLPGEQRVGCAMRSWVDGRAGLTFVRHPWLTLPLGSVILD